jgi:hypothetical protein
MLGLLIGVLIGLGFIGVAVVGWSSQSFAERNWRNQPAWLPSRGPFRRRTLREARTGIRAAAVLTGLAGGFLIVALILTPTW